MIADALPVRVHVFATTVLALAFLGVAERSEANTIEVSPQIVIFENGLPLEQRVIIENKARTTSFVTVEPRLVTAPGARDEMLRVVPNPTALGLAAAPNRLALEPAERRSLRLIALAPPGPTDRAWRVKVAPAVGRLKPGESGLSFTVAYDVLVIQRAENAQSAIVGQRADASIRLTNTGNSFALVTKAQSCAPAQLCTDLSAPRIYGGQTVEIPLANAQAAATFEITHADGSRQRLSY